MTALFGGAGLILLAGLAALLLRRRGRAADRLYVILLLAGCATVAVPVLGTLAGAPAWAESLGGSAPGGPLAFGLDPLSAWFALTILVGGAAAGVFGTGYLAPERPHRFIAGAHGLFSLLLVALIGVVTARSMVSFLAAWEVMAVCAYLLVVFEHEQTEVRRAGLIYIVLTHVSTLALIAMFAAMGARTEGRTFADFAAGNQLPSTGRTLAFAFALIGFGIKAGAVPMHFWLPGAHAAAPSHVSAVLSGVMLKAGIYGLLRVIGLLGAPPLWFGWTLLFAGLFSGILGVLWALAQHDLKRLLAYHSVENIGIILLGMGLGVLGMSYNQPVVALLGFTGAVLHTLNHALFKSLLFLGAGTVVRSTGTRVIDRLGGLGRAMPLTALAFGVGSVAIVGLPPLNGFVSEWVVFRGAFAAAQSHDALRLAVVGAVGLGLIGGLALACFGKLDGVLFLGQPRALTVWAAKDPGAVMLAPMLGLAAACVVIGLWPGLVLGPAYAVVANVAPMIDPAAIPSAEWARTGRQISEMGLGLLLIAGAGVILRGWGPRLGQVRHRVAETWACAGQPLTARMQYTASSFAAPLLARFGAAAGVRQVREAGAFHSHPVDPVQDGAVLPAWRALERLSRRLREWQGARIRWYLLSVVATLLFLLYQLMRWRGAP